MEHRSDMRHARRFLAAATLDEAVVLRQHAPTPTQADLQDGGPIRNVPLMRDENSYIITCMTVDRFETFHSCATKSRTTLEMWNRPGF